MKALLSTLALACSFAAYAQTPLTVAHEAILREDYAQALRIYTEEAERGDARAKHNLAQLYLEGMGVDKDRARAISLLEQAAQELPASQYQLGTLLLYGENGLTNHEAAAMQAHNTPPQAERERGIALIRAAAERGEAAAEGEMARIYQGGMGVEADGEQVVHWLQKGVARGSADAMYELGMLYLYGMQKLPMDCNKAIHWLQEAGKAGDWAGYGEISRRFADGHCLPQNAQEARIWEMIATYFLRRQSDGQTP